MLLQQCPSAHLESWTAIEESSLAFTIQDRCGQEGQCYRARPGRWSYCKIGSCIGKKCFITIVD